MTASGDAGWRNGTQAGLNLDDIRQAIDAVDQQIHQLISQRARLAEQVAQAKKATEADPVFYRPEREAQVLRQVMLRNQAQSGPLSDETVARLFREIMSACLALEAPQQIAYLGPAGTFTQAAAIKHFGHAALTHPLATIEEVFREVAAGSCHYGVVPVENSAEGVVNHTLDCFLRSDLNVIGEVELRIHQNMLIGKNTKPQSVTRIYAYQQALAQCRQWLDTHYPRAERVAVSSNAEAARRVAGEWHSAAIAGETAAELYDLTIQHANIEDHPDNVTRFLIIGRERVAPSGEDKTSLLVEAHDRAGALLDILKPLAEANLSMTSIETRPAWPDKWAYVFFIDLLGHEAQASVQQALEAIRTQVKTLRVLGSYPRAVL